MVAKNTLPIQFRRNYNEAPFDDMVFTTTALLNAWLTSPTRYAGQKVVLNEVGVLTEYILNSTMDAWLPAGGGGSGTGGLAVWVTATDYETDNVIVYKPTNEIFICLADHTSSAAFATDVANWKKLANYDSTLSTGVLTFDGLTIDGGSTTFGVGNTVGTIIDSVAGTKVEISFTATTANAPSTANGVTYVLIDNTGVVSLQTSSPTPNDRRNKLYLGRVVTVAGTIVQVQNEPVTYPNPADQIYDLGKGIGLFNKEGNTIGAAGTDLTIAKSSGVLFSMGANFINDAKNPHEVTIAASSPSTFAYATQSLGSTGADITAIDPTMYDVAGTITLVSGSNNRATIQRIFLFPSGNIRVQYGQNVYNSISNAISAIATASFVVNPNVAGNGILIGYLVVAKGCLDLSNIIEARFFKANKFGETGAGAGSQSVSNLQDVYENSVSPEITVDLVRGALTVKDNAVPIAANIFEVIDNTNAELLAVDVDEVRVNKLGFTGNVTAKIETTALDNLTYTDSESTKLLKKENYELYFQDWKDALPSTTFTSVSGTLTVVDSVGTEVQYRMATITQSSALTSDSAEIIIALPTQKADWHLTPIKLQELLQVSGGVGTFGVSIQSSTDGIAFTEVGNIPELKAGLDPYKSILQLASTVTHVKIKYAVIVPDDATSLIVHRIHIASDAFPFGQFTENSFYSYRNIDTRNASTGIVHYTNKIKQSGNILIDLGISNETRLQATKKCTIVATASWGGVASIGTELRVYDSSNVVKYTSFDYISGAGGEDSTSLSVEMEAGDYLAMWASTGAFGDSAAHVLNVTATAYADNVIVDAATFNADSMLRYSGTVSIAANVVTFNTPVLPNVGTEITTSNNSEFVATKDGTYSVDASLVLPTIGTKLFITRNSTSITNTDSSVLNYAEVGVGGNYAVAVSWQGFLYKNDIIRITSNTTPTAVTQHKLTISKIATPPAFLALDVSSERENVYSARIDSLANITSQSSPWLNSVVDSGDYYTINYASLGLTQSPALSGMPNSLDNNNTTIAFDFVTSTSARISLHRANGYSNVGFDIVLQRQGVDYKPQQAFIAGQVALTQVAYLKDVKSSGTNGGTFTAGAWQTRTLNTVEGDNIVSLSANQFTLQAGKYLIEAETPAYQVDSHTTKIRDISDSLDLTIGSAGFTGASAPGKVTHSKILGGITLSSAKVFELQHRCGTTRGTDGFGVSSSFGVNEVYAQVKITKLK